MWSCALGTRRECVFPVSFHLQGVPGCASSSQCDPRRGGEIPFKSTEGKVMEGRYLLSYTNSNPILDRDSPAYFGFVIYLSGRMGLGAFHSFPIWMESSWEVLSKFIGLVCELSSSRVPWCRSCRKERQRKQSLLFISSEIQL